MVSLLFHFGIVFYCLSAEKTRHAQIYTPIKAAIISIALTQNVIERQINDVTLNNKRTGGLLSESQQNENAVIKVADKKSTHSDENKVSDVQKKVIEKKEQKQPNKKIIKQKEEQQQNKKNDDVKQEQQAGQNSALSNAAGEQGAQNTRAVGDNISANYQSYIDKLRREIERHKRYPRKARNTHTQGKVLVNFTLTSSGEITRVSIAKSSMHTQLDQAALTAIAKSRSVGIPPEGLKKQITLSIEFEL